MIHDMKHVVTGFQIKDVIQNDVMNYGIASDGAGACHDLAGNFVKFKRLEKIDPLIKIIN